MSLISVLCKTYTLIWGTRNYELFKSFLDNLLFSRTTEFKFLGATLVLDTFLAAYKLHAACLFSNVAFTVLNENNFSRTLFVKLTSFIVHTFTIIVLDALVHTIKQGLFGQLRYICLEQLLKNGINQSYAQYVSKTGTMNTPNLYKIYDSSFKLVQLFYNCIFYFSSLIFKFGYLTLKGYFDGVIFFEIQNLICNRVFNAGSVYIGMVLFTQIIRIITTYIQENASKILRKIRIDFGKMYLNYQSYYNNNKLNTQLDLKFFLCSKIRGDIHSSVLDYRRYLAYDALDFFFKSLVKQATVFLKTILFLTIYYYKVHLNRPCLKLVKYICGLEIVDIFLIDAVIFVSNGPEIQRYLINFGEELAKLPLSINRKCDLDISSNVDIQVRFQHERYDKEYKMVLKNNCKMVIMGESGVGKTSVLDAIAGVKSSRGLAVKLIDKSKNICVDSSDACTRIGVLDQEPSFYQGSLYDNICLNYATSERSPVYEKIIFDLLTKFKLDDLKQRLYDRGLDVSSMLSRGQKQKLCAVRLLFLKIVSKKTFLMVLCDEPFSGCAQNDRELFLNIFLNYFEDVKVLIVTHGVTFLTALSSNILNLKKLNKKVSVSINNPDTNLIFNEFNNI